MVRDGLELICTLSIENPYVRILCLLAEHMFYFLIKYFILRNLHYFPKVLKILNNNCSEILI